jgi:hypothetical protein
MALISDIVLMKGTFLAFLIAVFSYVYKHPEVVPVICHYLGIRVVHTTAATANTNSISSSGNDNVPMSEEDESLQSMSQLQWGDVEVDDGLSFAFRDFIRKVPDQIASDDGAALVKKIDFTECGIRLVR